MRDVAGARDAADGGLRWGLAALAATALSVDPHGLGGIAVRALPGPARDAFLDHLRASMPWGAPWRRVPLNADEDRLLGGLDLGATLVAGRPVAQTGLLAEADGGLLVLPGAERLEHGIVGHLGAALDAGQVRVERDGIGRSCPARFGVIALDEGMAEAERVPAALADRLAFLVDLEDVSIHHLHPPEPAAADVAAARAVLPDVDVEARMVEAVVATALALGIRSLRAPIQAMRAARALAALNGVAAVGEAELSLAVQLVLAPRATQVPGEEAERSEAPDPAPPEPSPDETEPEEADRPPLEDILLAAAEAVLPDHLLDALRTRALRTAGALGKAGARRASSRRGRPLGVRRGEPRSGKRLALLDTLRAAAPWQTVRRQARLGMPAPGGEGDEPSHRVEVRRDDFRIRRFRERTETVTIFLVDASGSSALARLAEAKGAVELLLAEAYRRRDQVALLAFRGREADLLLPPTRSLLRAKRALAGLPGGGGTPLAAALDAAAELAGQIRRRGQTPVIVLLTDGKANIARDGSPGRVGAGADALAAGRRLRADGTSAILIDSSLRPQREAQEVAEAMGARYLALPRADARRLSDAVRAVAPRE